MGLRRDRGGGAIAAAALFALRQARFVRSLGRLAPSPADSELLLGQHTGAGPMLLGALRPRIVAPADFEARFQGQARDLVLAHERVHLARGDAVWAANAPEPTVRLPVWTQRPGGEDMARYYPEAAHEAGVTAARVLIDCSITAEGRLENCLVRQEDPAQYGFGEATIKLARHFQMAPEDRDDKPTAGGVIRLPIVFQDPKA